MWTKKDLVLAISLACLPLLQQGVFAQCYEFVDVSCATLVGKVTGCTEVECDWEVYSPPPPVGPTGRWVCPNNSGKEIEDDDVQGTSSISGTGTQYFLYGDTIYCSMVYDCSCDHISPMFEDGGKCANVGIGQDANPYTPVEEGTAYDFDYAASCSEL